MDEQSNQAGGRSRLPWLLAAGAALLLAILAGVTALSWSSVARATAASSASSAASSAAATASAKATNDAFWAQVAQDNARIYGSERAQASAFNAAAEQDRALAQDGWEPLTEGIYQAKATFSCGALPCYKFYIKVTKPCPGGVYVEGAVLQNGVVIDRANDWTAALGAGDEALVNLLDTTRQGDKIKVTGATCH